MDKDDLPSAFPTCVQASPAPPDSSGQGGQQRPCREAGAVAVVVTRLVLVLLPQLLLLL